jgi:hypothetical protein
MLNDATDPLGGFVVVDQRALRFWASATIRTTSDNALWLGSRLSTLFCDLVLTATDAIIRFATLGAVYDIGLPKE